MDYAAQLISSVVDHGGLKEVTRSGITEDYLDNDNAIVFKHILRHFQIYNFVPGRTEVLAAFPNYTFKEAKQPLEYYIDSIKETRRVSILEYRLKEAARVYQKDSHAAERSIRECLSDLQITDKSYKDINIADTISEIVEEYQDKKTNPGVDGIRSGWKTMDNETLGWHPGEFIVLAGEKYMGKSWIMIYFALQAALNGERVLFNTREMSQIQVRRRLAALVGGVPFDSLRKGILTAAEEKRFLSEMDRLERSRDNFHFFIAQNGVYTVDDMQRKAVEVDATCMFTDSVYLFQPDDGKRVLGQVEKLRLISQKCKLAAQELKIPFIASVQAGRRKTKKVEPPTLDNIEWSNAFSQDGDTVFFMQKDDLDKEKRRAQIWLLKSRDGQEADFFIDQDFEHMRFDERSDQREPTTEVFEGDEEETLFG